MTTNDKIKEVLTLKNLSPSHLADDIGVQRSSISHILSGRNKPSLDIIQKIVRRFPEFTYNWFLDDDLHLSTTGYVEESFQSTKQYSTEQPAATASQRIPSGTRMPTQLIQADQLNETNIPEQTATAPDRSISRILIFYTDGTFSEYKPAF